MLIAEYLIWHYVQGTSGLLAVLKNYLNFFWHFFSVGILLKTLFSPWKKDITFSSWRGLHPILYLKKIISNFFARFIGALVRIPVITIGTASIVLTAAIGITLVVFWIFLPIIFIFSFLFFVGGAVANFYPWLSILNDFLLFLSLILAAISLFFFYKSHGKKMEKKSLTELAKERWFLRVWNRLGFIRENREIKESFSNRDSLEKMMKSIGLEAGDLEVIINWELEKQKKIREKRKFWTKERLMSIEPIGKYWHFAYTVHLDKYSFPLPQKNIPYSESYLMGREKDIDMAEIILTRPSQNSFLLVGEPGVGKRTLVDLIAKKIKQEKTSPVLKYKRLVELELDRVVADFKGNDLINELHKIFREAAFAGNVILVINNIQEFLSGMGDSVMY